MGNLLQKTHLHDARHERGVHVAEVRERPGQLRDHLNGAQAVLSNAC